MLLDRRLLARDVRGAHLRIRDPVYLAAKRAVVVDAHRAGQKQAIVVRELLLAIEAERVVPRPVLGRRSNRSGRADGLETRSREEITFGGEIGVVVRVILHAARRLRTEVRPELEVERAGVVVSIVRRLVLVVEPI